MSTPVRTALLAAALAATPGCFVFDASLYMNRGNDAATDADAGAEADGGADGGTRVVAGADRCSDPAVPVITSSGTPFAFDTRGLADTFDDVATCTGVTTPGTDGFFAVDMVQGERWHFHVRTSGGADNPAVYILRTCDSRACMPGDGIDECGAGRDEHISFVARQTARYFVGVDNRTAGPGVMREVIALRPTCGNNTPEHSESCDDGNRVSGDHCDDQCRAEISSARPGEVEPNDDAAGANVIRLATPAGTLTARGRIGGRCDFDMYFVTVPRGGSLRVTMLDSSGQPCGASAPEVRMTMLLPDGLTPAGMGTVASGNACPVIPMGSPFATNLNEGTYYVRVTAAREDAAAFDYQLRFDVASSTAM